MENDTPEIDDTSDFVEDPAENDEHENLGNENVEESVDSEMPEHGDRPVSRAEQRIQRIANEKRALELEKENLKQQKDFYQRQLEMMQSQGVRNSEEDLDPDEKWRRETNQALQRHRFETQDALDQVRFLSKISANPALASYQDRVEVELEKARREGKNATREMVLKFIVGEEALAKLAKVPAMKKEAAARVKEAQGSPMGIKSNVSGSSKKAPTTARERLKDITF